MNKINMNKDKAVLTKAELEEARKAAAEVAKAKNAEGLPSKSYIEVRDLEGEFCGEEAEKDCYEIAIYTQVGKNRKPWVIITKYTNPRGKWKYETYYPDTTAKSAYPTLKTAITEHMEEE